MQQPPALRPLLALVGTAMIGATMGIFAREMAQELSVIEQVALRCITAGVILYLVCFRAISLGKYRLAPKRDLLLSVTRALSMFVFAISLGTIAFVQGNYATTSVLMALPVTAALGLVVFGERISLREAILVLLAFVGAALIVLAKTGLTLRFDWVSLCAVAAASFMGFGILARKWQSNFLNAYETSFLMLVTAAGVSSLLAVTQGWRVSNAMDMSLYTLAIGTIAGIANICFLLLTHFGSARLSSVAINNLLALQPVFGILIGFVLFKERLVLSEWFGCLLILTSIILIANPRLASRKTSIGK